MTRDALLTESSLITGWKCPEVKSLNAEAAAFRRNIDLGVKTIIGRRAGFFACQRS